MFSDVWRVNGSTKGRPICIVDSLIYCSVWEDHNHTPIGVTIDFEYTDDVHYELRFDDWQRFLHDVLGCQDSTDTILRLQEYFINTDISSFQDIMNQQNITFRKIAFYDIEFNLPFQ